MLMKNKSVPVILGLVGVLALLVIMYFLIRRSKKEGFENAVTVTYFFLPECPWCKKFKPEWDKFVTAAKSKSIKTVEVDASDPKHEKTVAEKGLKGFPTVIVTKGKDHEYTGDRTAEKLMEFVQTLA